MNIALDLPPPWFSLEPFEKSLVKSVKDVSIYKKSPTELRLISMLTCLYAPWRTAKWPSGGDGRSRNKWRVFRGAIVYCVFLVILTRMCTYVSAEAASFDGCDWTGSGAELPAESRGGVQPVYLRCSQGKVTWLYPRGALRVVLRHGTAGREFQGCIKVAPEFRGALIYLEAHRHLRLLYSGGQESSKKLHCFESRGGQAALYVEAETNSDPLKKDVAAFQYDLALLPRDSSQWDPLDDCRPCTPEETLQEFCSADFVARGIISAIYNDEELEHTALTVRASRVIRQTSSIFTSSSRKRARKDVSQSSAASNALAPSTKEYSSGVLHVPLKCQAKHGSGEFIFMGRQRLGQNVVWCAPRWEEWADLMRKAKAEGSAQCILES